MGFRKVAFNNFRNIQPREIQLSPGLNLLVGMNGSGKTNILEGINIISGWGPLEKSTKQRELANWDSGGNDVWLTGMLDNEFNEIIKVKIANRMILKLDDKKINATELRIKIPVLSFIPKDMSIVEDSASYRRRLIDMLLSLIVPPYAKRLHDYKKGIRYKNLLLKQHKKTDIIDRVIAPLADWIWKMRKEGIELISQCMNDIDVFIPEKTTLDLECGGSSDYREEYNYLTLVKMNREKERILRTCVSGPHRDDIIIKTDGKMSCDTLSRGYRRRIAIGLILALSDAVRRKLGKNPVLLLDEITAELDAKGREKLYSVLLERNTQVIAATAEPNPGKFPGLICNVKEGIVTI